jgi:hypothetical protein
MGGQQAAVGASKAGKAAVARTAALTVQPTGGWAMRTVQGLAAAMGAVPPAGGTWAARRATLEKGTGERGTVVEKGPERGKVAAKGKLTVAAVTERGKAVATGMEGAATGTAAMGWVMLQAMEAQVAEG